MKTAFGTLPNGQEASLYTICAGGIRAAVTDFGANLVQLHVPDRSGCTDDIVLGYADAEGYLNGGCFFGATVGRSANRIGGSCFSIGNKQYHLTPNENGNNLHSGMAYYHTRMWNVKSCTESSVTLSLFSPDGDQGFPGNAQIDVTYSLDDQGGLHIVYDAVCDQDTVFNLTNHSYFNLAGHDKTDKAMNQLLTITSQFFTPCDAESIPTGALCDIGGTPMDFRTAKPIGQDISADYEPLHLQGGYDHNFVIAANPCAVLCDPVSGRTMTVETDCPGVQFYAGNFIIHEEGKDGVCYGKRSGICLETQFYPDSLHHADWPQPIVKAGEKYHSETVYRFV